MSRKYNNLNGEIWTNEDDGLLVETVLKVVKRGDAVIDACREVEEKTNGKRSASACKYRWHIKLKGVYEDAYNIARAEGKKAREFKHKKIKQEERFDDIVENVLSEDKEREIMLDDILVLVKKYKDQEELKNPSAESEINKLRRENERLRKELNDAKEELASLKAKRVKVRKDKGVEYKVNEDGTVKL